MDSALDGLAVCETCAWAGLINFVPTQADVPINEGTGREK